MCVAVAIIGFVILDVWRKRDIRVTFVVPDDYRGVIVIEADPEYGEMPLRRSQGHYVVEVPSDGRVRVSDLSLLERHHIVGAKYSSGGLLRTVQSGGNGPDDIVLRYVGTVAKNETSMIVLTVGTFSEHQQVMKQYGLLR
jgi:hypothetical protein